VASVAALTRHHGTDDPAVLAATRDLAAERLAEQVRRVVERFPPLTPEQRDRIAALLVTPTTGGGSDQEP
jgi:hypothetical protein